ncbi:MAG: helicase-related protein, partial [Clostridiales bacterium]
SSRQKGNYKKIYQEMLEGKIDILVGTQMIAKGLDFPNVHLAAVIAADISLNIPDFRGGEKTFQLLTQITGRAGRRQKQGLAIIQTYYPQSPIIKSAAQQRFADFYQRELAERESHGYPPFLDLWRLLINGQSFIRVQAESKNLALLIASLLESYGDDQTVILGPSAPPYEKIKDRYRQQIILKSKNRQLLAEILPLAREQWQSRSDFPK